jgi:cold shock CspA family protein/ribosome-associated translation inhibitor RaiA
MEVPLEITLRDVAPYEEAVEAEIRKRADKLGRVYDSILRCRVVVEVPHRHRQHGRHFNVRIELSLPRKKVVVNREHAERRSREDINVAVRDAFDSAGRRLEGYARRQRGDVKFHEAPLHGRVSQLFRHYGFIRKPDGAEVYFHRNSVLNGEFDRLEIESEVRFSEEEGEEGPQASTVRLTGKHHIVE